MAVGGAQGVEGQQLQGGGAVNEQVVVPVLHLVQGVPQEELPPVHPDELHPRAGQGLVGGQHVPVFRGDDGLRHRHLADEGVVDPLGHGLVHPHAGGGVGLGVEVAQEDPLSRLGQGGGEVDAGGGLAHAALLVDDRYGSCHEGTYFLNMQGTALLTIPYYNKRRLHLQGEKQKRGRFPEGRGEKRSGCPAQGAEHPLRGPARRRAPGERGCFT